MALLFLEGAEHYSSLHGDDITRDATRKWGDSASHVYNSTSGRYSGHSLAFNSTTQYGFLTKDLGTLYSTLVVGLAIKQLAYSGQDDTHDSIVDLLDDLGGVQLSLKTYNGDLTNIRVNRGDGTNLLEITQAVPTDWIYLELKAVIHNTIGSLTFKINGVQVANITGLDTNSTGQAGIRKVRIQNGAGTGFISSTPYRNLYFDDIYVAEDFVPNGATSTINALKPNGDGANYGWTEWTPNSGSFRYNRLVDQPTDDDATYIFSAVSGEKSLLALENLSTTNPNAVTGTIHGIAVNTIVRNTGASHNLAQIINDPTIDTTLTQGVTFTPAGSYMAQQDIWETNPQTSSPFTRANVNNLQSGIAHL